jgi:hypothetical protein
MPVVMQKQNWRQNVTTTLVNYSMALRDLLGLVSVVKLFSLDPENFGFLSKVLFKMTD